MEWFVYNTVVRPDRVVYCMFAVADVILVVCACKKRKERERDLNGQVIEHNITCYGNDIHVCVLFVLCVVYLVVNHLLLHYIEI